MSELIRIKSKCTEIDFKAEVGGIVSLVYVGEITDSISDLIIAADDQATIEIPKKSEPETNFFSPVEIQITGGDTLHKGVKLISSAINRRLKFVEHAIEEFNGGKKLVITQRDEITKLEVKSFYVLYDSTIAIRSWTQVINQGESEVGLEYVSSFALSGIVQKGEYGKNWAERVKISEPSNEWQSELQWNTASLKSLGMNFLSDGQHLEASTKRISMNNTGSWSSSEWSPNGIVTNEYNQQAAMWQIEHNGSWHSEISDTGDGRVIRLSLFGPEENDHQWWKLVKPGDSFTTVSVGFTQVNGDSEDAIGEMTKYRRQIRRSNDDNDRLPVIFNDYMNCLWGDPTTEKEMPLIHAAAKAGAEYFVVDCGWYAPGDWWDSVGEWKASSERFPNGIREVTDEIKRLGMTPGLWLEIEVMGINNPLAVKLPDDWFFMRHGHRVIDVNRYHLDFRNPEVRKYVSDVVDRLVKEYGLGYIKMDYNITTGTGTDLNAESIGDGLLEHNRAYLKWIDELFEKYPDLVIENCGSGGMRHDYAMLARHSIQSMTDQTEYVRNGQIAAASASAVTPEQTAIWSYPLIDGDDEETIYNMVNTMLVRIHQSGYLNELTDHRFNMVSEGIDVYKTYREEIPFSTPIWPSGMPHIDDDLVTFGLINSKHIYLAIWNCTDDQGTLNIDLNKYCNEISIQQIYPKNRNDVTYKVHGTKISFSFPKGKMARLYKIDI
ncbi:melibiase subfamily protein [Paucilactobacillus oligofermentans DSM 15707 = LMG 22743]|uniref:Melibiase subfamily protein n=1 Tax=Paucilactobacillus oligofermentans DSM 15707 = LMG 22743 TaxID=1423778 RepID=A0A0R1REU3_9LACO|nr:alpha-galactosidase [Paucilactobacillus oligofermentans]KRL55439.1 melibiase subfamily protein [Paucilactobacillus oligofermentans DSM 15707 = LMG 22743]